MELQPFEGASNRTATVVLQKGVRTEYPTGYIVWRKAKPGRIGVDISLEEVEERTRRTVLSARPVNTSEVTSPWLTASPAALAALQKVVGPSPYQAHAGACTWANGVYWLRVLERQPDGLLLAENLHDVGKIKVKRVQTVLEPDLVYPLLRGRDVSRWRAQPSAYILVAQYPDKPSVGFPESQLKVQLLSTHAYLKQFEDVLRQRSGYKKYFDSDKDPFYSMYDVGEYTFAPYKVVWREQASQLTAAVAAGGGKPQVPDHKLMLVRCLSPEEAFYLAACLNSVVSRLVVQAYVVAIGMSTHVLEHVAIPKFDPASALHQSLVSLSQRAHELAAWGKDSESKLGQVEEEIDREAAKLWGITEGELEEIRRALTDLN